MSEEKSSINTIDTLLDKLSKVIENHIESFENKPISTSIKILVYFWIFKQIFTLIKNK